MPDTQTQTAVLQPNTPPETDYAALGRSISQNNAPTPEPAAAPEPEPKAEVKAEAKVEEKAETPKPETGMDKEVQKLSQRISSIDSRFDKLMEKIGDKGEATPEDAAKVKALQKEKEEVASKLKGIAQKGDDDITTADVRELAQDSDSFQDQMKTALEKMESEHQETKKALADLQAQRSWEANERAYPKVNHKDVWEKAAEDAATEVQEETEGLGLSEDKVAAMAYKRANKLFHQRASAAAKSVSAKEDTETEPKKKTATPITEPKATPGSGKVTVDVRAANPERYEQRTTTLQEYAEMGASFRKAMGTA